MIEDILLVTTLYKSLPGYRTLVPPNTASWSLTNGGYNHTMYNRTNVGYNYTMYDRTNVGYNNTMYD